MLSGLCPTTPPAFLMFLWSLRLSCLDAFPPTASKLMLYAQSTNTVISGQPPQPVIPKVKTLLIVAVQNLQYFFVDAHGHH